MIARLVNGCVRMANHVQTSLCADLNRSGQGYEGSKCRRPISHNKKGLKVKNTDVTPCVKTFVCWRKQSSSLQPWSGIEFIMFFTDITSEYMYYPSEHTYLLTYGAEPFLRSHQFCSPSKTSQHFMEPEGSIPFSQESSTGPYPESYQSNPLHPILAL
jgi:hypothetical protein